MKSFRLASWLSPALMALTAADGAPGTSDQGAARLTPAEMKALPSTGAGAGTSGVSGIRTTILSGDPATAGLYTIALHLPANTRIAAHTHRDARSAVVVSGIWHFGYGVKADDGAAKTLGSGSFYTEPANVAHFARTGVEPVVVYITGTGPTDTVYVGASTTSR